MANKITKIKERILHIAENKGIPKEKFFNDIGMTYGNFKGKSKETPINSNAIADILAMFPDINLQWLLTGDGEMIKTNKSIDTITIDAGVPLIPIEALAGHGNGSFTINDRDIKERYIIPGLTHADFMIKVSGSSMQPKYYGGDVVACKLVKDWTFFQWNRVYVLDTAQGALVKRVKKGSDNDHITLVSDNELYEPFEVHRSDLNAVALVIGVVRLE